MGLEVYLKKVLFKVTLREVTHEEKETSEDISKTTHQSTKPIHFLFFLSVNVVVPVHGQT